MQGGSECINKSQQRGMLLQAHAKTATDAVKNVVKAMFGYVSLEKRFSSLINSLKFVEVNPQGGLFRFFINRDASEIFLTLKRN